MNETKLPKLTIRLDESGRGKVLIGDIDISNICNRVALVSDVDDMLPRFSVNIIVGELDVEMVGRLEEIKKISWDHLPIGWAEEAG